jgi:ATP/maltotriose-dependent transcriptional regulator MalT
VWRYPSRVTSSSPARLGCRRLKAVSLDGSEREEVVVAPTGAPHPPAGHAGERRPWRQTYERLAVRDRSSLSAGELDALAEALFWLDAPEDSVAVRRSAYAAHLDAGDQVAAAQAAWQLYFDHALVGEMAVASGWLERARQHAGPRDGSVIDGLVAVAEADHAQYLGDLADGLAHAERAVHIGRAASDRDLVAMALQTLGRLLIAVDRVAEGVALLDEAMVAVINGELRPLFTGWVYCAVLGACHDVADLRRAAEWTDAALRWCDGLGDGRLYPGLCRVHRVELACLQGAWATAEREAQRARDELLAHDPRYAGEAMYLTAEIHRLRGRLEDAEAGFRRAHELGRDPHPGLALVWLASDRPAVAAASLRLALQPGPSAPLARAGLLAALVEAEVAVGALDRAATAVRELRVIASGTSSPYLEAIAAFRDGIVRLARHQTGDALAHLRRARALLLELAMPYEAAKVQVELARAAHRAGDGNTAQLELRAAQATFRRLGAARELAASERLLRDEVATSGPLTRREVDVLRLVARGRTNREIGSALAISEHTVARHLSNIFRKLGVTSRAAAIACVYEHLLRPSGSRGGSEP